MNSTHQRTELRVATAELAMARRKLEDARFHARHGMANALPFAEMVEHTTYHRWLRASAAFIAAR